MVQNRLHIIAPLSKTMVQNRLHIIGPLFKTILISVQTLLLMSCGIRFPGREAQRLRSVGHDVTAT